MILLTVLVACNVLANYASVSMGGSVAKLIERCCLTYALWFVIGVFCYVKRDTLIPLLKQVTPILMIAYIVAWVLPIEMPGYYANIAIGILLPFMVIGGAYLLPKIRLSCDLSYEIFLYHWIVLNVIVHFDLMNKLPWAICILIFTATTLALSWLSWRFVGKGRRKRKQESLVSH